MKLPERGAENCVDLLRAFNKEGVEYLIVRSLQKVCKSHQAAAFDFVTTLMPSANG